MILNYTGDIFASDEKIIAHGCNCIGLMGAGIARTIKNRYPEVYEAYYDECNKGKFIPGSVLPVICHNEDRIIVNLGTQLQPGADATFHRLKLSFDNMFMRMSMKGLTRVAMPLIGCGIGGLEVPEFIDALNDCLDNAESPITVAVYRL